MIMFVFYGKTTEARMTREEELESIFEAYKVIREKSVGTPQNAFEVGYGQIIKDGCLTEEGVSYFNDKLKELVEK